MDSSNNIKLRLNSIISHINKILQDTEGIDYELFKESDLLIRTSSFSLVQIGEQMIKLESILKEKYPNLLIN